MSTSAITPGASVLDQIMQIILLATAAAAAVPNKDIQAGAAIAFQFEQIALAGRRAHQAITGQPFDAAKLPDISPVA